MPIFLALLAVILIVSGVHGQTRTLYAQFKDDASHFAVWFIILVMIGVLDVSKTLRPVANGFLILIVVAMVIRSGKNIANGLTQVVNESKLSTLNASDAQTFNDSLLHQTELQIGGYK